MAVFAFRGDLRHLSCDAWYLPTDASLRVEPYWWQDDDDLRQAVAVAREGLRGALVPRVLPLRLKEADRATPVLAAVPDSGTDDWSYHRDTLEQFVEAALALDRPAHLATRPRRLFAVPLIGTGRSAVRPTSARHLQGLLTAVTDLSRTRNVDIAVVAHSEVGWAATQAVRRRLLLRHGPAPELQGLVRQADLLAERARRGQLVLFTGAGIGRPAGLPDWQGLLDRLATWAGLTPELAARLRKLNALDQAAFIQSRRGGEDLARKVADILNAPHHALAHGLLANLPVREHVTLNYDQLFERAAADAGKPVSVLPYEPAQDSWLLKLHGCIAPDRQRDIVLTRGDYLSLGNHRATLTGLVQALLVTRHMLFVGFGLSDDHLHAVIHDVRRALAGGREDKLGTALLLERDQLQEELWKQDLHYVPMSEDADPDAARRLEIFLDHVLLMSTTSDAHVFDDSYEGLLTTDERALRETLEAAFAGREFDDAPAWSRVRRLLEELGWPVRGEPVRKPNPNKARAASRREIFAAGVPALAEAAGLPTAPLDPGGFPLPAWARFTADTDTVAVFVADGESWRTVEKALAYGVAHARGRLLVLVLPEPTAAEPDPVRATAARSAFLGMSVSVRTHVAGVVAPVPPMTRAEAQDVVRETDLRGGVHDLQDAASKVADVTKYADAHPELVRAHRGSYLAWHCGGRMLLTVRRTRQGVLVRAGVHYSQPGPGKPAPLEVTVGDSAITPEGLAAITRSIENGVVARLAAADAGHEEHRLQGALAAGRASLGWGSGEPLMREFPALRPTGGIAFIDFLRLDAEGVLHIVETKIGDDEMLVLQGLDYWIWAQSNRAALESRFGAPITDVVVDYVLGVPGGGAAVTRPVLSSYAPAQLESLATDVRWRVHVLIGWAQPPMAVTSLAEREVPGTPYVRRRT